MFNEELFLREIVSKLGLEEARRRLEAAALTDMSSTLARVMEAELDDLSEPVWLNTDTGQRASSLSAVLRVPWLH